MRFFINIFTSLSVANAVGNRRPLLRRHSSPISTPPRLLLVHRISLPPLDSGLAFRRFDARILPLIVSPFLSRFPWTLSLSPAAVFGSRPTLFPLALVSYVPSLDGAIQAASPSPAWGFVLR